MPRYIYPGDRQKAGDKVVTAQLERILKGTEALIDGRGSEHIDRGDQQVIEEIDKRLKTMLAKYKRGA